MTKILVADDEIITRKAYAQFLKQYGFDVIDAKDGIDAISKFYWNAPDIVILDNAMPRLSGLGVALEVLAVRPSTKIIMISGNGEISRKAERIGIELFLTKPVSSRQLVDSVVAVANLKPQLIKNHFQ